MQSLFMCIVVAAALSMVSCDDSSNADQSADATMTQPATQPATRPSQSVAEHHGTLGDIPALHSKPLFIHMVTSINHDDNPACVGFNAALAALKRGRPVVMCIDAGAVSDLKVWEGKPTAFNYELPTKLKEMLASRYDVTADELPHTYQAYLYALHEAGATICANGFMAELVSLTDDPTKPGQLEPIVEMWSLDEILTQRSQASEYLRY